MSTESTLDDRTIKDCAADGFLARADKALASDNPRREIALAIIRAKEEIVSQSTSKAAEASMESFKEIKGAIRRRA